MENIAAMAEFTEILNAKPGQAYDFIFCNAYRFEKDDLTEILKELLYSLSYHVDNSFYGDLYSRILRDVQIELDESYDEAYQE